MTNRTLKTLEYDKVMNLVSGYAILKGTKQRLVCATPFSDENSVLLALSKTEEAYKLLFDYGVSGVEFFDEPSDEIERAEKGALLTLSELLRSARLLKAARLIRNAFTSVVAEDIVYLPEIAASLYCDQYLEKEILSKVLSDEKIADNASEKLFQLRRKIKKLNDQIREKLNSYIHAGDKYLQENIYTKRDDRIVFQVIASNKNKVPGIVHDVSASAKTFYIEPAQLVSLNNKIREIIYTLQGLELETYQILETSFKTLRDFFKSSVYQEKFPSDYVKFLEIRAYTTLVKEKKLSESEISKLSFDNYGKYAEKIERIVRFLMQDSPVDYDAVKKGASAKKDIPKQKESKCAVETESKKRFWKDWSLVKKLLYVILNMCTYCIPLVLHFAFVIVKKIIKKK